MSGNRQTLQGAATSAVNGETFDVRAWATTIFQVTGTFAGTITFEGTVDGTNWVAIQVANMSDGAVATTATAAGLYVASTAGLGDVRARISTYTSGSITVAARGVTQGAGMSLADVDVAGAETVTVSDITGIGTIAGQKTMAASFPVVVASDQSAVTVDATGAGDVPITLDGEEVTITLDGEEITSPGISVSQSPTVTAGAYSAGDAVGGLLTFANAARVSGAGGVLKSVIFLDDAGQDVELELWLFNSTFTAMADNAAWAPSQSDLRKLVAIVTTSDGAWFAAGTPSAAVVEASQRYDCSGGTSLFGQLVTRGTPTFAATDDVTVIIGLLQD